MGGKRVLMGVFGRPHGVRGLLRVVSYTADPAALASYGELSTADGRRFLLQWCGGGIASVTEAIGERQVSVADRAAAARLTNLELFVDRGMLPEPEPEEFYLADLIGLKATLGDGRALGRVVAVHDYGAGASLEIARDEAAPLLLPFTRAAVPEIDLAAGRIAVAPPAEIAPQGEAAA